MALRRFIRSSAAYISFRGCSVVQGVMYMVIHMVTHSVMHSVVHMVMYSVIHMV